MPEFETFTDIARQALPAGLPDVSGALDALKANVSFDKFKNRELNEGEINKLIDLIFESDGELDLSIITEKLHRRKDGTFAGTEGKKIIYVQEDLDDPALGWQFGVKRTIAKTFEELVPGIKISKNNYDAMTRAIKRNLVQKKGVQLDQTDSNKLNLENNSTHGLREGFFEAYPLRVIREAEEERAREEQERLEREQAELKALEEVLAIKAQEQKTHQEALRRKQEAKAKADKQEVEEAKAAGEIPKTPLEERQEARADKKAEAKAEKQANQDALEAYYKARANKKTEEGVVKQKLKAKRELEKVDKKLGKAIKRGTGRKLDRAQKKAARIEKRARNKTQTNTQNQEATQLTPDQQEVAEAMEARNTPPKGGNRKRGRQARKEAKPKHNYTHVRPEDNDLSTIDESGLTLMERRDEANEAANAGRDEEGGAKAPIPPSTAKGRARKRASLGIPEPEKNKDVEDAINEEKARAIAEIVNNPPEPEPNQNETENSIESQETLKVSKEKFTFVGDSTGNILAKSFGVLEENNYTVSSSMAYKLMQWVEIMEILTDPDPEVRTCSRSPIRVNWG